MIAQPIVRLASPVKLRLSIARTPRPRVVSPESAPTAQPQTEKEFSAFPMSLRVDPTSQTIMAHLSPLPRGLKIYGPDDYSSAAGDSMDDMVARVLQCLGSALQRPCKP